MTEERYEELMVKAVDGVASASERDELMRHLVAHPDRRRELDAQRALKALTDGWVARLEHDLAIDRHEASPGWRGGRLVGLTLLAAGGAALAGGVAWEIARDPEVPAWLLVGLGLGAAGLGTLLVSVIRWRWSTVSADPYTQVIR